MFWEVTDKDYVVSRMKEPSNAELKSEILTADPRTRGQLDLQIAMTTAGLADG